MCKNLPQPSSQEGEKINQMHIHLPEIPIRESIKMWNRTAKECYEIKCNCKKCFIYDTYFKDSGEICHMKYYVFYLLQKLGKPKGIKDIKN